MTGLHARAARRPPAATNAIIAALAVVLALAPATSWGAGDVPAVERTAADNAPRAGGGEGEGSATNQEAVAGEHEAEPEHAPAVNLKTLGLQLLNFAVLLFILVKFGGGAINKALAARHQQLKADLVAAAELRAQAEAKLSRQEVRLASLESEIAEMRRGLKAEAEAEKARLIAAAEERAARIKSETAFLVEQQVREAEVRLRRESADTALKVAEDILRRAIGSGDQQRLLDAFVNDVELPALPSAGRAA